MPADRERIANLLRKGHGDVGEIAALLGVTVEQVQAVINDPTDATPLPSAGGGVSVGTLTDEALPAMDDWTAQADPTRPSLLNVQADVTLVQGAVAVTLTLNVRSPGNTITTPAQFAVSRDGAEASASVGSQTYLTTLTALLAPGDVWSLSGPAGQSEIDAVNERSL